MTVSDTERGLLQSEMDQATIWCFPCALQGLKTEAKVRYYVYRMPNTVPVCLSCFSRALDSGVDLLSSTPVQQPTWVKLVKDLLR